MTKQSIGSQPPLKASMHLAVSLGRPRHCPGINSCLKTSSLIVARALSPPRICSSRVHRPGFGWRMDLIRCRHIRRVAKNCSSKISRKAAGGTSKAIPTNLARELPWKERRGMHFPKRKRQTRKGWAGDERWRISRVEMPTWRQYRGRRCEMTWIHRKRMWSRRSMPGFRRPRPCLDLPARMLIGLSPIRPHGSMGRWNNPMRHQSRLMLGVWP